MHNQTARVMSAIDLIGWRPMPTKVVALLEECEVDEGGDMVTRRWAVFSPCRKFRYVLNISWDATKPQLVFFMLNPSTADAMKNDPTVERCQRRAQAMGFGSVVIINLFAYRATNPKDMLAADDPIGRRNDDWIEQILTRTAMTRGEVICAWGTMGGHRGRDAAMVAMLDRCGPTVKVLDLTKDGHPKHPLYVSYNITPTLVLSGKMLNK